MKIMAAFLTLAVLALLPSLGDADLPVHCLRHHIAGEWEFTLGPSGQHRSSCGHQRPDVQGSQPPLDFVASLGPTSKARFSLEDPDTVSSEDGATGTWTMIYDEGFEVAVGEKVFFAFSGFEFVPDGKGGKTNVSHCETTQVGWYRNTARSEWGCYVAKKVTSSLDSVGLDKANVQMPSVFRASKRQSLAVETSDASSLELDREIPWQKEQPTQLRAQADSLPDPLATPAEYKPWVPGSAGFDEPMPSKWQESVAGALNLLQLGWRAATYEFFQGKTPRELNKFAGVRRHRPHRGEDRAASSLAAQFSSFLGLTSRIKHSTSQTSFDWRSVKGQNWLQPVVTQGDCGSCYTISTIHMLTARNRISHNDHTQPAFSVSFPLYCSEYNQGCDGGYGFLQSKWSEDVGLVPEACAPFSEGGGSCRLASACNLGEKRYRATDHHYVGGFYGGSTEEQIRQELVSRGPVVMSFEPKEDFMYYRDGIYRSSPNRIHQEWEQVDHAVLLVGYGEETGQAFWTMQNSWGTDWGEGGYFRMARGTDESGCESIVVAADVAAEGSNPVLDDFLASI